MFISLLPMFLLLGTSLARDCTIDDSNACGVNDLQTNVLGSSNIYPGGDTRCAFDDYSAVGVPFSTQRDFFFQVFPNKRDRSKLLIFFQPGGACVSDLTCSFAVQCLSPLRVWLTNPTPAYTGVFNRFDLGNVFRDWNIVHIPYCTGDLHAGDAVRPAASIESILEELDLDIGNLAEFPERVRARMGELDANVKDLAHGADVKSFDSTFSEVGLLSCLTNNQPVHHAGFNNSRAALSWALDNYPEPEQIVVAGSSAGSLGVQLLSAYIADLWQVKEKPIKFSLLPDSYVGVLPEDKRRASSVLNEYGTCDVDLKMSDEYMASCRSGEMTVEELVTPLVQNLKEYQWLFLNSEGDIVQRFFHGIVSGDLVDLLPPALLTYEEFEEQMRALLDAYKAESDRVSSWIPETIQHTYLILPLYNLFRDDQGRLLGPYLRDWLADAVKAG